MTANTNKVKSTQYAHPDGTIYFSHIPKTAGTSFTVILDRFFATEDIFSPQLWHEVGEVEKVREKKYQLIRGHFGAAGHVLSQNKLKVMTLLRHPVAMAYSTYQHIKRDANTNVHQYVKDKQLSFEAFLTDDRTQNLAKNRLIKSLSFGLGLEQKTTQFEVNAGNYRASRTEWNGHRKSLSSQELLQKMKAYLDDCLWFGLQEEFELSLNLLCDKMSWPPIGHTSKLNINHNTQSISETALQQLKELNPLDFEFYDYAKIKFDQQVDAFVTKLGAAEPTPENMDRLIDENYQLHQQKILSHQLAKGIEYEFSQVLLGCNWHRREWNPKHDLYFRWTGPAKETAIDFWLQPTTYQIKIYFINIIDLKLFETLSIRINDVVIDWSVSELKSIGIIEFSCHEGLVKENGLLRISMTTEELISHDRVFNSKDKRKVGLAINKIEINPEQDLI
ncbi:MAG: hypothetical protein ACSHWU_10930 [Marinicella sp.]